MKKILHTLYQIPNTIYKILRHSRHRLLLPAIGLLLALIPVIAYSLFYSPKTQAAWFNDNWSYRQKVTFGNTGSTDANKKVKLDVNTSALISAATLQTDCGDLRFTDHNGVLLRYYLDSAGGACNTTSSDYYVLVPVINSGTTELYMYYGNASVATAGETTQFSEATFSPTSGPTFAGEEKGESPVGYWKFDEGHKTYAYDSTPNNNIALVTNGDAENGYVEAGNGHDGAKSVSGTDSTSFTSIALNAVSGVSQPEPKRLQVGSTPDVTVGDDVLVIQITGTGQGNWETCDVAAVATNDYVECEADLIYDYQASGAQLVIMPQWTTLTISNGGTLTASAWNGTTGGIVAFRCSGTVNVESGGTIHANSLGFTSGGPGIGGGSAGGAGGGATIDASGGGGGGGGGQGGSYGSVASAPTGGGGGGGSAEKMGSGSNANAGDGGTGVPTAGGNGSKTGSDPAGAGGGGGGAGSSSATGGTAGTGTGLIVSNGGTGGNRTGGASGGGVGGAGATGSSTPAAGSNGNVSEAVRTSPIGNADLSTMYFGSNGRPGGNGAAGGGGGGGTAGTGASTVGAGGGIIYIGAETVTVSGAIQANGGTGTAGTVGGNSTSGASGGGGGGGGSGGGAGGAIYLWSNTVTLGSEIVTTIGGAGGGHGDGGNGGNTTDGLGGTTSGAGGIGPSTTSESGEGGGGGAGGDGSAGGNGRIHIEYNSLTGSSNPDADLLSLATLGSADWKSWDLCVNELCLYHDGANDTSTLNISSAYDFDRELASGFTIQGWVRPTTDGEADHGEMWNKGANSYLRFTNEGTDGFADLEASLDLATTDATLTLTDGIELDRWYHIALAYTNDADDEFTVYLNGQPAGVSANGDGALESDNNDLLLGGKDTANLQGFIDEFKVYNKERTADQLKTDILDNSAPEGSPASFGHRDLKFISDGLVGYWRFDDWRSEDLDGNTADLSGNEITLTNNSETGYTAGKFGEAASYDGATDYFSTASTIYGVKSLSFWVYPDSNTNYYLQLNGSAYLTSSSGTLSATGFDNPTIFVNNVQTSTITASQWSHVVVTTDTPITASALEIGRANNSYFDGKLDELRLYRRVLNNGVKDIEKINAWSPEPVLWLKLDENIGTSFTYDKSSWDNSVAIEGGMKENDWIPGKYGSALTFDGVYEFLELPDKTAASSQYAELDIYAGRSFTISAWIRHATQSSGTDIIFSKNKTATGSQGGVEIWMTADGDIACGIDDDNTSFPEDSAESTTASYDDNNWHYVTCVKNENNYLRLYIDGVQVAEDPDISATGGLDNNDWIRFGRECDDTYNSTWVGEFDDFKQYNYQRSETQILQDMNADHPIPGSPLGTATAQWEFDEGYGTTAYDSTTNANNLTLSSASWTNSGKFGRAWNGTGALWLSKTDDDDFDFVASDNFTLSGWVKSDSADNPSATEYILDKEAGAAGYGIYFNTGGQLSFSIGSAANTYPQDTITSAADIYDNTWHYFTVIKTGTTKTELFIDAVSNSSDTSLTTTGSLANSETLTLGDQDASDDGDEFFGDLDQFYIFRTNLSADQIKLLFTQGKAEVWGSTSTDSSGNPTFSSTNEYCPPGQGTACTGPVAHWKMDENNGQYAYDISGNNNYGTLDQAIWTTGKFGSAIQTNGTSSSTSIPKTSAIDFDYNQDFTIGFWVKDGENNELYDALVEKWSNSGEPYSYVFRYHGSDGKIYMSRYDLTNTSSVVSPIAINNGQWHYITGVKDGSSLYLYTDGQPSSPTTDNTTTTTTNNTPIYIGKRGNDQWYYNGIIDDLKIYNYARTPTQIAWEYNRGAPTADYKFDECSGATAYDASRTGTNATITPGNTTGSNDYLGTCESAAADEMWANGKTGKRNYSLDFDGTNDYAYTANVALIAANSQTYTNVSWGAWLNPATDPTSDTLIHKNNEFRLTTNASNQPQCEIYSGSWQTAAAATTTLPTSTWSHVLCTYDGTNIKLYLNGILAATQAETDSLTSSSSTALNFGRDSAGSGYFDGRIDEVQVYGYALNATQVKTVTANGAMFFGPATGSP